jgi:pyruvate formate lyase activating enzyme
MIPAGDVVDVRQPPGQPTGKVAELWKPVEGTNKIMCTACARYCKIGEGQVGLCGIRGVHGGKLWLYVYGRVITGHVDPIEKKPVQHYRPGSKVFSIATTGCNWLCHPAGTPILLADGQTKPVEEVAPGDALWSVADARGLAAPGVVTAAGSRMAPVLRVSLTSRPEPLYATEEHPVFTEVGWKTAAKLCAGDRVLVQGAMASWEPLGNGARVPLHAPRVHPKETSVFRDLANRRDLSAPEFEWSAVGGVSIESGRERVYSFECVPFHSYIAADVVVHNCRYCFLPGTKVITDNGSEKIEAIFESSTTTENPELRDAEGRLAFTHRGRWRRIAKAFQHLYSGPVLSISVGGVTEIQCTPDHRVYASIRAGPVTMVQAQEVSVGDCLAIPRPRAQSRVRGLPRWAEGFPNWDGDVATATGASVTLRYEELLGGMVTEDYWLLPVRGIRTKTYIGPVYNIEVEGDHSYTANGLAVANCQNADISQRRKVEGIEVTPEDVVRMTSEQGCQGLAYTYNQPTIFIEFARDVGVLARKAGLINIFVSNGYDTPETVGEMEKFLDCVTVDFKGSGETEFVRKYINIPNADPIFQTLLDMRDTKKIHIEITDLIVPQVGDNLGAARKLSRWVNDNLGPDTPIHFLRFHPDYKMMEFPWTPVETLERHCAVAKEEGLKYVYIGNVPGHKLENTYCPGCGAMAVKRYGFDITGWYLDRDNKCKKCGTKIAIVGRLEKTAKENRFYGVLEHR